jgi:lipoprotein-anchoring transpeptidase ErfK/SrfK
MSSRTTPAVSLVTVLISTSAFAEMQEEKIEKLNDLEYTWFLPVENLPIAIHVDTIERNLMVIQNGKVVAVSQVSIGSPSTPTPLGDFLILVQRRIHYSSEIEGAVMPYSLFFDDKGNAIHAGDIGEDSNGCIRIPYFFAESLFDLAKEGTTVRIR